ncbi:magnesium transporter [Halopseudomonas nanhaiensis]|uniref:magnesium transporter n=1 Tax=Halopseudomonas nanhaiensis TaxID=2830842 RepID=UPI003C2E809B
MSLLERETLDGTASVQGDRLGELQTRLEELHPADIAYILESLPLEERLTVWQLVKSDRDGEILLEVSDAVRETLIADMDSHEIIAAANTLDADELADLAPDLPRDVVRELMDTLDAQQRDRLKSALSYDDDQVGSLMDFDMVTIRDDVTLEVVSRYLRRFDLLPDHTDKLFVVDTEGVLRGVLPVKKLLVSSPDELVVDVMSDDPVVFNPLDDAGEAAQAFERYDLISAPVVDAQGKLFGRLTIDEMVDYIREESEAEVLNAAGLREEEDIFASVWKSVRNRWAWLAINLCTALIASRVIGLFEGAIEQLVALAALMPIVAGIGGNSGNQTITMIVRGLATGQVQAAHGRRLIRKETGVALINGLFWGLVLALIAYLLYGNAALSLVLLSAMTLNMLLAAVMGVWIPLLRVRMGGDPALGSSVMITAITDSGGFFIFLGLATLFLL